MRLEAVTPDFKETKQSLLDRIEQLETDLANERERADTLSDELDQYKDDTHEYYTLVNRDDLTKYETNDELLNDMRCLQDKVRISRERRAMGVPCDEELQ